jgi:anti-sigma factor RsiW
MRDKTRDELQDLLPELLHGRLSATDAVELERAVAADPDLAAELTLLRAVHASHQRVSGIDIGRIVAALPSPPPAPAVPEIDQLAERRAARRPMISRSFARAAALLVVVGGGTMVSVWSGRAPAAPSLHTTIVVDSPSVTGPSMQLGLGTSTDELSVDQLRALESDIRSLDGMPSADPDAATELLPVEGA